MKPLTVIWREASPDVVRTSQSPADPVRHAVPQGQERAMCGLLPKHGWQLWTRALIGRECKRCHAMMKVNP